MKAIMKRGVDLKSGKFIPKDVEVEVESIQNGIFAGITYGDIKLRVPMPAVGIYCTGFISMDLYKKKIRSYNRNGGEVVSSMTGERVEPDGYDCKGFPSVLIAGGFV